MTTPKIIDEKPSETVVITGKMDKQVVDLLIISALRRAIRQKPTN